MIAERVFVQATSAPTLAVITVCWNALADLQKTCASVAAQQHPGLVHVVVDGGSSDGTAAWLTAHSSQFAAAISEPDKGIYDAMNKALTLCPDVDWLIFLNAGDTFFDAELVKKTMPALAEGGDFYFGDVLIRSETALSKTVTYPARRNSRHEMPGCHQSCFVRSSLMKQLKFDLTYKVAGDFECWLRATRKHGAQTGFFDGVIATVAPEGFSARNERTLQSEYAQALRTHVSSTAATLWLGKRKLRRVSLRMREVIKGDSQ